MAVVGNSFEVASEPPHGTGARGGSQGEGGGEGEKSEPPDEQQIQNLLERRLERFERVWAY
jgi:hypothetical protein